MPISILVADDHPFVRRGIRETLSEAFGSLDIAEAADGEGALEFLRGREVDLAIFDIAMPGKDGLALMEEALGLRPELRVLVMSVYSEQLFAERAYRGGAKGYLPKVSPPEEFVEAVRRILAGGLYVSPDFAELLLQGRGAGVEREGQLSDRELDVLRLLAAGESLKEIGSELGLSAKTVSTYKTRAMEKLQIATNAELLAWTLEQGMLPNAKRLGTE